MASLDHRVKRVTSMFGFRGDWGVLSEHTGVKKLKGGYMGQSIGGGVTPTPGYKS